ncbi:MAG: DNA-directed RNA polymerase subunit omega [Lachnospiraceae bacterium]|nr:DNA-directed RNA polymerase subunit omega [Lachnospiraceae bacterium]
MLHPSYTDLMEAVNEESVENSEGPVVQSRYSIVLATAKRARQIVSGSKPQVSGIKINKPLSIAVDEIYNKKVKILSDEEELEEESVVAEDVAMAEDEVETIEE